MTDTSGFAKLVPGFDFLQGLVKNAGSALPGIGQWVAPTLNPQELEKKIEELRTVQYWLEQNARMLGATIQALEVQRMTLSTLQTMNVQMDDLRAAMLVKVPEPHADKEAAAATGAVDPMQWWGALTKQFGELAGAAMKQGVTDPAPTAAVKTAGRRAARPPGATARKTAR